MTAKTYLTQAFRIDQRINSKLEQVQSLRMLAENATSTIAPDRVQSSSNPQRIAAIIDKIVDLENEINEDIDALVDLKREVKKVIESVPDIECRMLLELRYLCFKSWREVACALNYSEQHTFRLHSRALAFVNAILKDESKCD